MQDPVTIPCHIAIQTSDPLTPETIRQWYACASRTAPNGVTFSVSVTDEAGMPRPVRLVYREEAGTHTYTIPLTRDLTEGEAEAILRAFADAVPDLDFDASITGGLAERPTPVDQTVSLDEIAYAGLCDAWARRQHETWMRERTAAGWRYGTILSLSERTHPLLLPWEHLPAHYRRIDTDQPQGLLDLLNAQGYAVITKNELDALLALARGPNA